MNNTEKSINIKSSLIQISDLFNDIKENNSAVVSIALTENLIIINMGDSGNYTIKSDQISANQILEKMFPESK